VVPVEVARAVISADGQTMTYKQVDWICRDFMTHVYHRKSAP